MHLQLGTRLLFEEAVVVVAWCKAKKAPRRRSNRRKENIEKAKRDLYVQSCDSGVIGKES
jgi:hypothetical protein